MMKFKNNFIILFGWCFSALIFVQTANYKIQSKDMKCSNVDSNYLNITACKITAARGKRGLLTIVADMVQPIDDLFDHVQFFTRTSTGRIQPWMINVVLDACNPRTIFRYGRKFALFDKFYKFFDQMVPNLKNGCPFTGAFNLTNWEMDQDAVNLLPPIIPEATFLIFHRIYIGKTNHTIAQAKFVCEVRPVGTAELIKLG